MKKLLIILVPLFFSVGILAAPTLVGPGSGGGGGGGAEPGTITNEPTLESAVGGIDVYTENDGILGATSEAELETDIGVNLYKTTDGDFHPLVTIYAEDYLIADDWGQAANDAEDYCKTTTIKGGIQGCIIQFPSGKLNQDTQIRNIKEEGDSVSNRDHLTIVYKGQGSGIDDAGGTQLVASAAFASAAISQTGSVQYFAGVATAGRDALVCATCDFVTAGFKRGDRFVITGDSDNTTGTGDPIVISNVTGATTLTVEGVGTYSAGFTVDTGTDTLTVLQAQIKIGGKSSRVEDIAIRGGDNADIGVWYYSDNYPEWGCRGVDLPAVGCVGAYTGSGLVALTGVNRKATNISVEDTIWSSVLISSADAVGGSDANVTISGNFSDTRVGVWVDNPEAKNTVSIRDSKISVFDRTGIYVSGGAASTDNVIVTSDTSDCDSDTFGTCRHVWVRHEDRGIVAINNTSVNIEAGDGIVFEAGTATEDGITASITSSDIQANDPSVATNLFTFDQSGALFVPNSTVFRTIHADANEGTITVANSDVGQTLNLNWDAKIGNNNTPPGVTITTTNTSGASAQNIDSDYDGTPEFYCTGSTCIIDVDDDTQPDHTFIADTVWDVNRDITDDTDCGQITADLEPLNRRTAVATDGFYARWTGTLNIDANDFFNIQVDDGGGPIAGPLSSCWTAIPTAVDYDATCVDADVNGLCDVGGASKYPVVDVTNYDSLSIEKTPGVLFFDNVNVVIDCSVAHPGGVDGVNLVDLALLHLGGVYQGGPNSASFAKPPRLTGNLFVDFIGTCDDTWGPYSTVQISGNPFFSDGGTDGSVAGELIGNANGLIGMFLNGWVRGVNDLNLRLELGVDAGVVGIAQTNSWGTTIVQPKITGTDLAYWRLSTAGATTIQSPYFASNRIGVQLGQGKITEGGNSSLYWHDGINDICPDTSSKCKAAFTTVTNSGVGTGLGIYGGVIEGNKAGNFVDYSGGHYVLSGLDVEMPNTKIGNGFCLGCGIFAGGCADLYDDAVSLPTAQTTGDPDGLCDGNFENPLVPGDRAAARNGRACALTGDLVEGGGDGATCTSPDNPAYLQAEIVNMVGFSPSDDDSYHYFVLGPGAVGADSGTDPNRGRVKLGGAFSGSDGQHADSGTEDAGDGSPTTLVTDSSKSWTVNEFASEYQVSWISGANAGTSDLILANDATTLTIASHNITSGDRFIISSRNDELIRAHPDATAIVDITDVFIQGGTNTQIRLGDYEHFVSDNMLRYYWRGDDAGDADGACFSATKTGSSYLTCTSPPLGGQYKVPGPRFADLTRRWIIHDAMIQPVQTDATMDCDISLITSERTSGTLTDTIPLFTTTSLTQDTNVREYVATQWTQENDELTIGLKMDEGSAGGCVGGNQQEVELRLFPLWR